MAESSIILNNVLCITNNSTGTPTTGTSGGAGTKVIISTGTSTTTPYALGRGDRSLWYGVPSGASHIFYGGNSGTQELLRIETTGLNSNTLCRISGSGTTLQIYDPATASGPLTALEFVRGSMPFGSDIYTDWRIKNQGGDLIFERQDNSSPASTGVALSITSPTGILTFPATFTSGGIVNKINLYNESGRPYGFGVSVVGSTGQLDYTVPGSAARHSFYVGSSPKLQINSDRIYIQNAGSRARDIISASSGWVVTTPSSLTGGIDGSAIGHLAHYGAVGMMGYLEISTEGGLRGINYDVASDERLKKNITISSIEASQTIEQINFIEFDWKENTGYDGHAELGVSAQNLQSINSRFVNELSNGYLTVAEPVIFPYILKSLQEQIQLNKQLEERVKALEDRLLNNNP